MKMEASLQLFLLLLFNRIERFRSSSSIGGLILSLCTVDNPKVNSLDDTDYSYLRRAMYLASLAVGKTTPNPCVGCVLVKNGTIVGEGWHHKAGMSHAEVNALNNAGVEATGATAYVSLEPCNHFGRTPPCTHALLRYIYQARL